MGDPSSGLIAEFFLQNLEDTHLKPLLNKNNISAYFRYVDDILIIFDSRHTDIINIQDDFNTLHPYMKFTAEPEFNNQINFLDITIHKRTAKWTFSIYRKLSFTDSIIPHSSNHPPQHKHAAIRYLHNRLNTYHLQHEEYKEELDTIHDIMQNNGFPTHTHTHTHTHTAPHPETAHCSNPHPGTRQNNTQMGPFHILRKRDYFRHKHIQES
jgi:hypothetical protein